MIITSPLLDVPVPACQNSSRKHYCPLSLSNSLSVLEFASQSTAQSPCLQRSYTYTVYTIGYIGSLNITYIYIYTYVYCHTRSVYIYIYMYVCIYIYAYSYYMESAICIYIYIYIWNDKFLYIYIYIYVYSSYMGKLSCIWWLVSDNPLLPGARKRCNKCFIRLEALAWRPDMAPKQWSPELGEPQADHWDISEEF